MYLAFPSYFMNFIFRYHNAGMYMSHGTYIHPSVL